MKTTTHQSKVTNGHRREGGGEGWGVRVCAGGREQPRRGQCEEEETYVIHETIKNLNLK